MICGVVGILQVLQSDIQEASGQGSASERGDPGEREVEGEQRAPCYIIRVDDLGHT